MITIGDNVLIGFETKIFVHAFALAPQRLRPVTIGSNVMIGGFCVIAPGVTAGAIVFGNQMRVRKSVHGDANN